eukprot:CAMPEP_0170811530 /NCGR_PEP_ID=MMETSP0733-20121128/35327_1 /TAXON_ID=186038 /ORGANISM="Fragilariopsis kerguelensis, Strain L26-C5" /LENGTH=38 /DNA_ID= /DNA_START= /DNA_END= /DNA_ORIENTATION=
MKGHDAIGWLLNILDGDPGGYDLTQGIPHRYWDTLSFY